jgi:formylglycine-generating enzyme required for sulfatase activity
MYRIRLKDWTSIWASALLLPQCAIGMQARVKPPQISIDSNDYIAISAGWSHNLALKSDGTIVGWGDNRWGMADPPDGNDFVAIAAGTYYSLALKSDGSIVGWGSGARGTKYPPDGNDFVAISAGSKHALALKRDGSFVGWGGNRSGAATLSDGNDFVAIAAGFFHSLALRSDGSIVGWGSNATGAATPPDGNDFVAIAVGHSHSLALKSDGSIVGWGSKVFGQTDVPEGKNFIAIAADSYYSLALKSDGSIVGWGDNFEGKADPPKGNDFIAITAGLGHSAALKSDGSIVAWGDKHSWKTPAIARSKTGQGRSKKTRGDQQAKKEVEEIVEVKNVSFLKSINPPPNTIRLTVDDKISIDLVYIKPGSFTMGRNVGWLEKSVSRFNASQMIGKYPDDWPARKIKITKGFYIGKYKVTSAQFCEFLNIVENPQKFVELNIFARIEIKDGTYVPKVDCENCEINVVPWTGAAAFCEWLSQKTGFAVRLPTEAEWEFTARGPEGRQYPWGEELDVKWAESGAREYKKYPHPWSCAAVDAFPENVTPHGVVGMIGSIGEWCSDFYGVYYLKSDVIDPQGPSIKDLSDKSLNPFDEKYHVYRSSTSVTTKRSFGDAVGGDGIYGLRIVVELPAENP